MTEERQDLPQKPPPEKDLPPEGEQLTDQELEELPEEVPEEQFLAPEEASADDTVDDAEEDAP